MALRLRLTTVWSRPMSKGRGLFIVGCLGLTVGFIAYWAAAIIEGARTSHIEPVITVGVIAPTVRSIDYGVAAETVLLFARRDCGACQELVPELRSVVASAHMRGHQIRLIHPEDAQAHAYGASLGLAASEVVTVDSVTNVTKVPLLLVVSTKAMVVAAWVGSDEIRRAAMSGIVSR